MLVASLLPARANANAYLCTLLATWVGKVCGCNRHFSILLKLFPGNIPIFMRNGPRLLVGALHPWSGRRVSTLSHPPW